MRQCKCGKSANHWYGLQCKACYDREAKWDSQRELAEEERIQAAEDSYYDEGLSEY